MNAHVAPSILVAHAANDRFDISVRSFRIEVDQPASAGGDDTAPTPTELFVASLVACQAFYAQRFLRRHGIDGHVRAGCRWTMAAAPARVGEVEVTFEVPALTSDLAARLQAVVDHCTVHNSLVHPPEVTTTIVADNLSQAS